jgi:hypothetical protein
MNNALSPTHGDMIPIKRQALHTTQMTVEKITHRATTAYCHPEQLGITHGRIVHQPQGKNATHEYRYNGIHYRF